MLLQKKRRTGTPLKSGVSSVNRTSTTVKVAKKVTKKPLTAFRTLVLTRHPSHRPLRTQLPLLPFRSVVRLGSTTPSLPGKIECNSIDGVRNSSSKLLMKRCFTRGRVKTAEWFTYDSANLFINESNNRGIAQSTNF